MRNLCKIGLQSTKCRDECPKMAREKFHISGKEVPPNSGICPIVPQQRGMNVLQNSGKCPTVAWEYVPL